MNPLDNLIPCASLSLAQRDEMFALLTAHFDGVTRDQFERDLAGKNWVIEIRRNGRLLGFSTLLVSETQDGGRAITVVYSGDTIVAPEGWGSPALARSWIAAVNRLRAQAPDRPCYWLLLTSGFRTYRLLPVFWREFHPRYDAPTSAEAQRLLPTLARFQYGSCFEPEAGIVRFPNPQRLRGDLASVPAGRVADPHVRFFLSRNPGHAQGDELVCLTRINETNLTAAGRRML